MNGLDAALLPLLFFIAILLMLAPLTPLVFYALTLRKALALCAPRNRAMAPDWVWLLAIPFFNVIWHFVVVLNLSTSLEREFADRGEPVGRAPGRNLGLATCSFFLFGALPYLSLFIALAALVCWIIYWVRVGEYARLLETPAAPAPPSPSRVNHAKLRARRGSRSARHKRFNDAA